ncbi:HD domain-containing protein [Actinomadura sp. 7K507]|uniref:HD domain-containing protein n=1 Tax=Actinomadura sp. 7K507 TaxID=2530365 RepID=UPI001045B0B8|nr:HD domain-containing protein [Actinomadura sp. 7K507]TDC75150.1 HD domain-containing protein [Actinomadura sp. 7K507]
MFTRMDEGTREEWMHIRRETLKTQDDAPDRVLPMLAALSAFSDGFAVDQLQHSLQTAAHAEAAGAGDEMVVAALCHDMGKVISTANHAAVAAEILRPYVCEEVYQVIHAHQTFEAAHYGHHFGWDPAEREAFREEPWYAEALRFADEWDQVAFDPGFDTPPIEHFAPRVRRVFGGIRTITK